MGYEVIDRHGSEDEDDDEQIVVDKVVTNEDASDEDEKPKPEMGERDEKSELPDLHDITIDQIDSTDLGITPAIKPEVGETENQRDIDYVRKTILEDGVLDKVKYPKKSGIDEIN